MWDAMVVFVVCVDHLVIVALIRNILNWPCNIPCKLPGKRGESRVDKLKNQVFPNQVFLELLSILKKIKE